MPFFTLAKGHVLRAIQNAAPDHGYPLCEHHFSVLANTDAMALIAVAKPQLRDVAWQDTSWLGTEL